MRLNATNCLKEVILSGFDYYKSNPETTIEEPKWSVRLLNPIHEMISSPYEDIIENSILIIQSVLREKAQNIPSVTFSFITKLLEQLINELLIRAEQNHHNPEISSTQTKSIYLRIVLTLNCFNEVVFNHLDKLDNQTLYRLSSTMITLSEHH